MPYKSLKLQVKNSSQEEGLLRSNILIMNFKFFLPFLAALLLLGCNGEVDVDIDEGKRNATELKLLMKNAAEVDDCVGIIIEGYNLGKLTKILVGTTFSISASGDADFFSDSACTNPISSYTVSGTEKEFDLFIKNSTAETVTANFSAASYGSLSGSLKTGAIISDVTVSAGVTGLVSTFGYGMAVGDYDGDGHLDFFVNGPGLSTIKRNNGNRTFSNGATIDADTTWERASHWADFDNDGDLDIVNTWQIHFNTNDGAGGFTSSTPSGIVGMSNLGDVAWLDYDLDGDLDLVAPDDVENYILSNDGDGTFTAIASATNGMAGPENGETVIAADINNDLYPDVLYRKSTGIDLWKNDGDGTFTEIGGSAGVSANGDYNGAAFFDYDNDGDMDLYLGQNGTNKLYRNNGDETFTDVTVAAGVGGAAVNSKGIAYGDYDNDGYLDLLVANDGSQVFYRNDGDGTFTDLTTAKGLTSGDDHAGSIFADFDNDGDLDLFVTSDNGMKLYDNTLNSNSFLKVKVEGRGAGFSPKDGTGTRIELWNSSGTQLLATRVVTGGEAMGSHAPKIQHFGLAGSWGGRDGTYTIKAYFTGGTVKTLSAVVPKNQATVVGSETYSQAVLIQE